MALTKEDLQAISSLLDAKLQPVNHRLENVESRLENVESRLEKLESDISDIKVVQTEIRGDIIKLERKISDAYQLALDAWGKSTENRNWFGQGKLQA